MCVLWISILPLSTIFGLEFGTMWHICFGLFVALYMFFSLLFRFFLFSNNILVYIYYLCQLGITTAVQTEKQKNVLNLEPLNVVL